MDSSYTAIVLRLFLAILAGGVIGLERTYHGRPAGFRTHTLVCMASALLMQFTMSQWVLFQGVAAETMRIDPTRMAQGIMTGIGFLGAGVIVREGLTVRGLTTAASLWITAAVGILVGVGLYFAGFVATVAVCGVLAGFRWLERVTPTLHYGRLKVCFRRTEYLSLAAITQIVADHDVRWDHPSFHLEGEVYTYTMTVWARNPDNYRGLAESLNRMAPVLEFRVQPTGD